MKNHSQNQHRESMLSVEDALDRILGFFDVLEMREMPLVDVLGQVLAQDVVSVFDVPFTDNSAMDGYAVQADSVKDASRSSPIILRVKGTIAAGQLPKEYVEPGTAIRIMTGATIPDGADAVVPFEETDEIFRRTAGDNLSEIGIYSGVKDSTQIRPAGQDIAEGELVLARGTVLRPAHIGVMASLGLSKVKVVRRPSVAVLATGDELIQPGDEYQSGKIYDSNSYSVAAEIKRAGGIPKILGIAGDTQYSLNASLSKGLKSDFLITSAGVSKGDYDVVKDVLSERGTVEFWSVNMRPAKPLAFGVINASDEKIVPLLGLPGNPVSALVAFEQFAYPAISKMLGKTEIKRPIVQAVLEEPIYNPDGRRVYARAIVTKKGELYYARLTGPQGSNLLMSMARANGLAICPEGLSQKNIGDLVDVQMIEWPEGVF